MEHFNGVSTEMGSQRTMVKNIVKYVESLFMGLSLYFELTVTRKQVCNYLYTRMRRSTFRFIKERLKLSRA